MPKPHFSSPSLPRIITGSCHHVTETNHGRFRAQRIPSWNYRHRIPSRSITEHHKHHGVTARYGAKPITDNHSTDALECCEGFHAMSHHCQRYVACQTKTPERSASQRITAHHGESQSIMGITEHHGHHGVRHGASRSGANHGRSQHR